MKKPKLNHFVLAPTKSPYPAIEHRWVLKPVFEAIVVRKVGKWKSLTIQAGAEGPYILGNISLDKPTAYLKDLDAIVYFREIVHEITMAMIYAGKVWEAANKRAVLAGDKGYRELFGILAKRGKRTAKRGKRTAKRGKRTGAESPQDAYGRAIGNK